MQAKLKEKLENMHYGIVGNHSAVEICTWCKHALLDEGFCYKQKFYGIRSHLCCQMTCCLECDHRCRFCWRPIEESAASKLPKKIDEPKDIVDGCIAAQRKKLSGFKGNDKSNMDKWKLAQEPMHFAISLSGEPTIYPKLPELIKEIHSRGKTTFLVTNGTFPEMIERLKNENALPTQMYVSLDAPTKELYEKIDCPIVKDGWERLMKTLKMLKDIGTRTVLRITLIKGMNDFDIENYAKIIKMASPHFVEVKSYMFVGYSRKRMKLENMPSHDEVVDFSKKLAKELGWKIIDEKKESRVTLLAKEDYDWRIMHFD